MNINSREISEMKKWAN